MRIGRLAASCPKRSPPARSRGRKGLLSLSSSFCLRPYRAMCPAYQKPRGTYNFSAVPNTIVVRVVVRERSATRMKRARVTGLVGVVLVASACSWNASTSAPPPQQPPPPYYMGAPPPQPYYGGW